MDDRLFFNFHIFHRFSEDDEIMFENGTIERRCDVENLHIGSDHGEAEKRVKEWDENEDEPNVKEDEHEEDHQQSLTA